MRFLRRSLVGVFLLAMTLALLAWAGNTVRGAVVERMAQEPRSFPQRERIFAVNVLDIAPQTITPTLTVFGELRSQRTLDLRSPVGGTVLMADAALIEGGAVKSGQTLLQIDPTEAQTALDRVNADTQDAQAELRDAQRSIILAQDELTASQQQVVLRQTALTRARNLQTRGVGIAADVETAELAVSGAQAAVLASRQALAQAEARIDQANTRMARQAISQAEAERNLADTTVVAGFDGILSEVSIGDGGRVIANERFALLVDPSRLEVSFRVSTSQYARLLDENGDLMTAPITVALDVSGVNLTASGQITRESASVGTGQTGRLLFANIDNAPGFRPGDFVTVSIAEPDLERVALVPATAVAADGTVLVLADEDRLEAVAVDLLRRQGDDVIIRVGDIAGRAIVAERSPLLGAGIKVNPIRPGQDNTAPSDDTSSVAAPDMIALDDERRAKLVAFVTESQMPDDAKARVLSQLEQPEVASETVTRLEQRMGS